MFSNGDNEKKNVCICLHIDIYILNLTSESCQGKKAEVLALDAASRLTGNWLCDGNR